MLVYQQQDRVFVFDIPPGSHLQFPSEVTVELKIYPEVPFGGVKGVSRNGITDVPMSLRVNAATGRSVNHLGKPLFDPINVILDVADTHLEMNGNNVTVKSRCSSLLDLQDLVSALFYAFPAILNIYIPDPPFVTHVTGQVGDVRFKWLYDLGRLIASITVTSKNNQESLVAESWRHVTLINGTSNRRLIGAFHYFHVGCRLLAAGSNRFEFLAEAVLNFSRSLQSLFEDTRDNVREEIAKLNEYKKEEIEAKFISALFLRNEFDVAHVNLSILNSEQLNTLHDYCEIAEGSIRKLLKLVIQKIKNNEYVPKEDPDMSLDTSKVRILNNIRENLAKLSPNKAS